MNEQRRDERGAIAVRPSVIPPGSVVDNGSGSDDDDDASPALPCPAQTGTNPCHRRREGSSSGFSRITGPLPTTTTTTPKAALSCTRAHSRPPAHTAPVTCAAWLLSSSRRRRRRRRRRCRWQRSLPHPWRERTRRYAISANMDLICRSTTRQMCPKIDCCLPCLNLTFNIK